jgi:predicted AlkP superfamily pyrophosphatase or phosphodiesterase
MSRVVMMMTDGMRPDALQQASTPNLDKVLAKSAHTMTAQSVMPSVTISCHTSIFYSLPPNRHGVLGIGQPLKVETNGLIEQLKIADKQSAFVYNWDPLRAMSRPRTLTASFMANIVDKYVDGEFVGDRFVADHACREISNNAYDFTFAYWGTIDECGHKFGWMSDEYFRQVEVVDGLIGEVLDVLPEDTTLLVHSDHGGHDHSHGTDIAEDMTIPWMISGPNIKQNYPIESPVSLLDIAPTLAPILEIEASPEWEGQCVDEIFIND